ncbi:hypothetical protein O181_017474 [Austropuccinia psidii MF-1]|uniref:Uncharacterized protein n=1 Tax=Austropuccinia psidii MF-1 TaxID=1389203 RepID=A0A9Q3GST3_9BASI|nr:hypothetical protein [Austropuccinia psidii MF-1]
MRRLPPHNPLIISPLLASESLPNPLRPLACLHACTAPPSPPSPLLMFPWCPQDMPPTLPSTPLRLLPPATYHAYADVLDS